MQASWLSELLAPAAILPARRKVLDCAGKHQVLVFVHSRKETAKTARYMKETALKEDKLAKFMKEDR